jgi:hypothetical protein
MTYAPSGSNREERERKREWSRHPAFAYLTLAIRKSEHLEAF